MSSQRKDTLKNLLKKSMFASTAALMLASTSSLVAALVNRNVIADNAVLSSGANLDQNGGNVPFNPAFVLTYNNAFSVPAIAGIYVNAVSIPGPGASMTFPNDITLGPIVPPDLILANHSLNMIIPAGVNVTLNGGTPFNPGGPPPILAFDPAVAAAAEDAAGNVNPFAPGLGSNVPVDTYFINNIDFQGTNGQLTIQTIDNGDIVFAAATTDTTITNGLDAIVNVKSNLQVKDSSWATELGTINISEVAQFV